mgnify:CR=1 FL=1
MTGNGQPKVTRGNYSTAFQISANVTNPEDYVQFLDLIYQDQESYDFFTYGDEALTTPWTRKAASLTKP